MTMPHLMNCAHKGSGWCLDCVGRLSGERDELRDALRDLVAVIDRDGGQRQAIDESLVKSVLRTASLVAVDRSTLETVKTALNIFTEIGEWRGQIHEEGCVGVMLRRDERDGDECTCDGDDYEDTIRSAIALLEQAQ